MKKSKLVALIILLILIPMIAVITYFSPISKASSFVYQYGVTNGGPPFVTNIDGKQTEVYCSQAGGSLWSSWRLTFQSAETRNMSAGLAYAFRQCCSINSRQNLIWMSEIANNISTPDWHSDYDDALEQYNKIAGFNEYYKKLQETGKDIKFEESEAGLQSSENGVYKLGPFKLSFYKSTYSKISRLYLKTDTGETIEVKKVNFGGYTGTVDDIDSGEEFYVLLSQEEAKNASKVTLGAEYKYEEASGTYTYYVPTTPSMDGRTVQRLVTIDYTGGPAKDDATGPEIELTIDLAGKVFKDNLANKDGTEDGILSTGDEMLEGVEVTLFDSTGKEVAKTTTDKDGYYEFKDQLASRQYYVRFKYNGQLYEPTTYQRVSKIIDNSGTLGKTSIEERSYATDGKKNRKDFNNKFTPVDSTHEVPDRKDTKNPAFDIYAYTGPNGIEELLLYGVTNSKEELQNINFGIKDREQFDMNLRKDLVKVDLSINGKTHKYDYPGGEKDLEVEIRGTDIPDYNRAIRSADLKYKMQQQLEEAPDKLQVKVTYKIQLKNQSVGKITGYVTDLADYYDTSYEYIRSYDENKKEIAWEQQQDISGSGKTYHTMHTTALADQGIDDKKWIFVEYRVTDEALRALVEEGTSTKENFAQISGYKNTYREDRKDLNGQLITNAGENAGLIDVDSTPANLNPTDSKVQEFVAFSKTDEYQDLGGEEKTKRSMEVFEDDADAAPGLKLIVDDSNKRRATGTVFEDAALAEKLEQDNERLGDGTYSNGENLVNQIKVQLICTNGDVEVKETRTNDKGEYEFTDYIPGDYNIKFIYGDYESLVAVQPNDEMYTGQDYKSTIYKDENYPDAHWYNNNIDTKLNDAKDDQGRRQDVNSYSKNLKYKNATVLNSTARTDEETLRALADNTNMNAVTANMSMEIEYVGQENAEYAVKNIDLGIIERPHSDIFVEKTVSNLKLSTTGDGQTIFNSNQSVPNLTWKKNTRERRGLIQATVDENLLHGATLELTFSIKVINTGETDYEDETYYNTGVITDKNKIVTLDPLMIADYVSNNLVFDANLNTGWQEITDKSQLTSGDNPHIKAVDENKFNGLQKVIVATDDNPILKSDPIVPEKAKDNAGKSSETQTSSVLLTKVVSSDGSVTDDTEYENIAEVIETYTPTGRRTYNSSIVSIPGNYNIGEPDTALSERISIVPPFGAEDVVKYITIGIAIAGILAVGIILIKKKVLNK